MKWEKWIKYQLRVYLCRQVDLERLNEELKTLDYVYPSIVNYRHSESKRGYSNKFSVVESIVIRRRKTGLYFQRRKEWIMRQVEVIERSLNGLTDFHRSLIEMTYLTIAYSEEEIGKILNIPVWSVKKHRYAALRHLYDNAISEYKELQDKAEIRYKTNAYVAI